ncbi:Slp family lipoprotein [Desulfatiglans anilini]|uniref:Slp family lipoprotein n=1 Tax=Desulfatiglans anilini TaxID=90728 RepID=UPI000489F085|nr:Slp family lipoprotein [Desulfatiglans anilini]
MKKKTGTTWILVAALFLLGACSPISPQLRHSSEVDVPFETLVSEADAHKGKTVLLGGKVLSIQPEAARTLITVQQCPLNHEGRPHCKTDSGGVFLVSYHGKPLGPLSRPDQEITAVGKIIGLEKNDGSYCASGCLVIESEDVYLWAMAPPADYKLWPRYPYDRGARSWEGY